MVLPAAVPRGPVIVQQSNEGGEAWCQPGQRQEKSKGCCCLPGEGSSQLDIHTYSRSKRSPSQRKDREQHGSCERTSCTAILVWSIMQAACHCVNSSIPRIQRASTGNEKGMACHNSHCTFCVVWRKFSRSPVSLFTLTQECNQGSDRKRH